jgi:hypothetical protein
MSGPYIAAIVGARHTEAYRAFFRVGFEIAGTS